MTPQAAELEARIAVTELETAMDPKDPAPHFALALLYQQLPGELSPGLKRIIEEEKLRVEGRDGILDMPRDSQTIIAEWGPNPTWNKRLSAAYDYIRSANSLGYLAQDNVQRAVMNLSHAIRKTNGDQLNYGDLLHTLFITFCLDERFQPLMPDLARQIKYTQ